jgi:hypothetical protein
VTVKGKKSIQIQNELIDEHTSTSLSNAFLTLSLDNIGMWTGADARDGDGFGGGKGWSNGVPYGGEGEATGTGKGWSKGALCGCWRLRECWNGAVGTAELLPAIVVCEDINGEKCEGFTRFVDLSMAPVVPWTSMGIPETDEPCVGSKWCKCGDCDVVILVGGVDKGAAPNGWSSAPVTATLEVPPELAAACSQMCILKTEKSKLLHSRNQTIILHSKTATNEGTRVQCSNDDKKEQFPYIEECR